MKIAIAGCGALGSQIALGIATPEIELWLYDFDTVDENNVVTGTSAYSRSDIGILKTNALAGILYNKFGCEAIARGRVRQGLWFSQLDLIVDCFDNVPSRKITRGYPTVHVGVSPQIVGSVIWDNAWKVPTTIDEQNLICTHEVGRNIITMTCAVAIVIINHWIETGEEVNRVVKRWEVF